MLTILCQSAYKFALKNTKALGGFTPGALHRAPGPHTARLARVALFNFLFLINGAQPSLAHGHKAKLHHCLFALFRLTQNFEFFSFFSNTVYIYSVLHF